jgi:hypothetical protein
MLIQPKIKRPTIKEVRFITTDKMNNRCELPLMEYFKRSHSARIVANSKTTIMA